MHRWRGNCLNMYPSIILLLEFIISTKFTLKTSTLRQMLTVSGISSLKIVKFFNRERMTTVHNHKRRYLFTTFVNSSQKNRCSRFVRQGTENSANRDDVRDRRGNLGPLYCVLRAIISEGEPQKWT